VSGPSETTQATAGQIFEVRLPLRCPACPQSFYLPANLARHKCEPQPAGFRSEADAEDAGRDV
jgi:hypothetical protein